MKTLFTLLILSMNCFAIYSQVKTIHNNPILINDLGVFKKNYGKLSIQIKQPDTAIIVTKVAEDKKSKFVKPLRIAEPVAINLNVITGAIWKQDPLFAYARYSLNMKYAKSLSVNFDEFFLPVGAEMYIYNKNGKMVTGPITYKENNNTGKWGSSIYQGDEITIEVKVPLRKKNSLRLHLNNIAYGFSQAYGFGNSSSCNINVLCGLGSGWEAERNAVALVLSDNGSILCSGAMINNACNDLRPYFLTANHCLTGQDVSQMRYIFQYWSAACTPSQDDPVSLLFYGSTLRATDATSDFGLLELDETPSINSNINYAGWSRNTSGISETRILHHPAGDVMKVSRDVDPPTTTTFLTKSVWQLDLDDGATDGGSSGAPYFNQDHRIIGQHYARNIVSSNECLNTVKYGGRFDVSWTGGGTSSTRLSDWLDPQSTGLTTTNTLVPSSVYSISGPDYACSSDNYTLSTLPSGSTFSSWSVSPSGIVSLSSSGTIATISKITNGTVTLTANFTNVCGNSMSVSKYIVVGLGANSINYTDLTMTCEGNHAYFYGAVLEVPGATNYEWYAKDESNPSNPFVLKQTGLGNTADFPLSGSNKYFTIRVVVTNPCGTLNSIDIEGYIFAESCSGGASIPNNAMSAVTTEGTNEITIFPNPAKTTLKINIPASNFDLPNTSIRLVDISGKVVKRVTHVSESNTLNIENFSNGLYLVEISSGRKKIIRKVLKN